MSETPEIEKDVPPPTNRKIHQATAWMWEMEIGDSVFFKDAGSASNARVISVVAWGRRQNPARRFVSRQQPQGGVRVWRVE